ncbi:MAG: DUF6164 family protein [Gammaproteobacteria bacterium]
MSFFLFKLNDVSTDEAEDIRSLLDRNEIAYYETTAGRWGLSIAAIWLKDEAQLETARRLINEYQRERNFRIREEYKILKAQGRLESAWDRMRRHPILYLLTILLILFIVFVSIRPFVFFLR